MSRAIRLFRAALRRLTLDSASDTSKFGRDVATHRRWRDRSLKVYWDLHGRAWDDELKEAGAEQHIEAIAEWLTGDRNCPGTTADLGCGTGTFSLALAACNHRVVGIDLSSNMIRQARSKCAGTSLPVRFEVGNLNDPLPFSDDSLDNVLSVRSIQFVELEHFIAEIRRVLKPGGRLLLEWAEQLPTNGELAEPLPVARRVWRRSKGLIAAVGFAFGWGTHHSAASVRDVLATHGFSVVEERSLRGRTALLAVGGAEQTAIASPDRGS